MAQVLKVTEVGDGRSLLHVAVDTTVVWTAMVPTAWLGTDKIDIVARAVADRYAAAKQRIRRHP